LTNGKGCYAEARVRGGAPVAIDIGSGPCAGEVVVAASRPSAGARAIDLVRCADDEEAAHAAAAFVVGALRAALVRRGRAVWVPSTGRTVVRLYALLRERHRAALDWEKVEVFQMDEVAAARADATARHFLVHRLLEPLDIRRHTLMRDASA